MKTTPRGLRPHIVLTGKRNAGKSSFLNRITGKEAAIVSQHPGTTTDPVYINMELLPFGPVTFVDTAGMDDSGDLGRLRTIRSRRQLSTGDYILYIARPTAFDGQDEEALQKLAASGDAHALVLTHGDIPGEAAAAQAIRSAYSDAAGKTPNIFICDSEGGGYLEISGHLCTVLEAMRKQESSLLQDLVTRLQLVLMVVPVDMEAPRGRLILPQVQAIREVLDADAASLVVKDREIDWALSLLREKPDLAITDSQVVLNAAASIPSDIPLTTFSILFSRLKGDLGHFVESADILDTLENGDRILIAETCTHKTVCDDIGRVKIPRWIRQYSGKELEIDVTGGQFPADLDDYRLVIHCGGCMITRKMMMGRVGEARERRLPVTNYGVAISKVHGLLDRVLEPFGMGASALPGSRGLFL